MQPDWEPITQQEFEDRLKAETASLSPASRERFERYRVEPWQAIIRRSDQYGDERVWVVAQDGPLAVFLDDVEDEFAVGTLDAGNRLSDYGYTGDLTDALSDFPERYTNRDAG
jgi:hypothetical protein